MTTGAGYSGTPLIKKLGIKDECDLCLINGPANLMDLLRPLPRDVAFVEALQENVDVLLFFAESEGDLASRFVELRSAIRQDGGLWIAWPKQSSGVVTDLSDAVVRELGLSHQLVDNKVCAIDETWSALRFVYRLRDRE